MMKKATYNQTTEQVKFGELVFDITKIHIEDDETIKRYQRNHFWVWVNSEDSQEASEWYYTRIECINGCKNYLYGRKFIKDYGYCFNEEQWNKTVKGLVNV